MTTKKTAKKPPNPEESLRLDKEQKAFALAQVRRQHIINEPTYFYKVGERVQYGATKNAVVREVLDGGKILLLDVVVENTNYGRPFDTAEYRYVAWHDIEPWRDWSEEPPIKEKERFRLNFSQRDLGGLIRTYYYFGVEMNPEYQRGLVWDLEDKQNLIESIFQDVDVGKFVLVHRRWAADSPGYEIIDGKQRLSALIEFFEGRFEWRGKLFRDMHPRDRSHLEDYPVSVAELPEQATRATILDCFVRLNTSGKPQDQEHLRKVKAMLAVEQVTAFTAEQAKK